ncbi:deoxyribodipyrimidine photo-lyase [Parahaliea maris]|uniref:Deoxyribodipyrimidine photo-lyase n=1 Tax=Parahaliea maris TaxID=2716870 RepID=A0A5C9A0T2_9GAMM|nr:deoxyribodipyrimidine photo-lyase [Parahaliea maris]TXS93021.1 deoxyribodipyrimidine photo-lyase [Parahaliea maris]
MSNPILFWFRQDLRLKDHPGLQAAAASGRPVIPLYILDDTSPRHWRMGGASRWWLQQSLAALGSALQRSYGLTLVLRRGSPTDILPALASETGADTVMCTRQYEPWAADLEQQLHRALATTGVELKRYPGNLLFEPGTVLTQGETPFKVFTPFWKSCLARPEPRLPLPPPERLVPASPVPDSESLEDWQLYTAQPDWAAGWSERWHPGAQGAGAALARFLGEAAEDYSDGRDIPSRMSTSRLSPHLHFGEISPRAVWHASRQAARDRPALGDQIDKFLSELGWREFSYHLLHFFPTLPEKPFRETFGAFPWRQDDAQLRAWQQGQTGYPLVDAGMRELWQTGYMHNRVRMVTASFLTKHLMLHWREGEDWFWDTLVDADLANNAASWQWVAGSGADAAPYFRIFNPVTQGQKVDAGGDYIRRWVPELAELPDKYLHRPFDAPESVLKTAGVVLGDTYPEPLVPHAEARQRALDAYRSLTG